VVTQARWLALLGSKAYDVAILANRVFNRDSPYEPRTGVKFCALPAFWQDRRVARTTAVTSGSSNGD
jgi:hypothetical protein